MALIHERLYRSDNLARVDLKEYVTDLTRFLLSTFSGRNQRVEVENKVGKIELPVDQAVPCGLIVNELVCNCLKYAFPDKGKGVITISSNQFDPEYVELSVTDNGAGLPDDFDPTNSDTLGQKLVQSLVRQLGGSLTYECEVGTKITIRFPILENDKQGDRAQCLAQKC